MGLPVLTSLPSPTQLGGTLPQFSPSSGSPRDVRSLARALCSHCSCQSDPGCLHNCEACGYKCGTCSCQTSLACKYNCDKCEDQITNDWETNKSQPSPQTFTNTTSNNNSTSGSSSTNTPTGDGDDCAGLVSAELCGWGEKLCRTIASTHFPHCHYDCQSCS